MYSLSDLETFILVAHRGGITAAAHQLGISAATTSYRITKLEKSLKLMLFHRNSRALSLTGEGAIFLEKVERIMSDLRLAEIEAGAGSSVIRGHLRVTASTWVLSRFVLPHLQSFQTQHPDLTLEFTTTDHFVPLVEDGQDCAIRVGRLPDSALIARRVCNNHRIICAAPSLLERIGTPLSCKDLECAPWVCLPWQTRFSVQDKSTKSTLLVTKRNILVTHSDALTEAALQGVGVVVKSRLAIKHELEKGSLVEVLPGLLNPSDAPVWFVTSSDARNSRKTTVFGDMICQAFGESR